MHVNHTQINVVSEGLRESPVSPPAFGHLFDFKMKMLKGFVTYGGPSQVKHTQTHTLTLTDTPHRRLLVWTDSSEGEAD